MNNALSQMACATICSWLVWSYLSDWRPAIATWLALACLKGFDK